MARNNIQINDLDFDDIKENLKTFLQGQTEFSDYDFEGSGLSILVDSLAYATHYIGMYGNFNINEMWLTSAILRDSVVAKAKDLGYFPNQRSAPKAIIRLSITPSDSPSDILVPKNTKFTTSKDGETYTFITTDSYTLKDDGTGTYVNDNVEVYEGKISTAEWTFDINNPQRFIIQQPNIDDRFLSVSVASSDGESFVKWSRAKQIVDVGSGDEVFFLDEADNNRIEIYFGNDNIGKALDDGNVVKAEYFTTFGDSANGCNSFELIEDIDGYSKENFNITTQEKATAGALEEGIEDIRHNAPKFYEMQNRAVTKNDYKTLMLSNYSWIETINIWGGEDSDPPEYGKVMISVKPKFGDKVSPNTKKDIVENTLNYYSVVGVIPEIVDPTYLYLNLSSTVEYDPDDTVKTKNELTTDIETTINDFFGSNVTLFGEALNYSKLIASIDDTNEAILNNLTEVEMEKRFTPEPNSDQSITVNMNNAIKKGTIYSEEYGSTSPKPYQIKDDGNGNIQIYKNDSLIRKNAGSVNYSTGKISLNNFTPDINENDVIKLKAKPQKNNIESIHNTLISLGDLNISLTSVTE